MVPFENVMGSDGSGIAYVPAGIMRWEGKEMTMTARRTPQISDC